MYDDTVIGMILNSEQSFKDLFAKELELLSELKGQPHFTFNNPHYHSELCTSHDIPTTCLMLMMVGYLH